MSSMKSRLIIAVVGVVATFLLAACRGGPSQSAAFVPAEQTVTADTVPHIFHITPFRKAKKPISKSSGQDVYTLWGWSGVKVGRTAGTVTTFGAPATDGNAGPMAQVAIMTSSTEKQHVYVDSLNTLRELTDAATGIVMLAKTVSSSKTEISVCENGKLVGIITITNGKVGTQKKAEPTCPKSLDVLVPATDQPANSDATSSYPTEKNVDYDLCELSMDGGAIPTAATLFTAAKTFDKSLTPLGPAYKAFATTLKSACHSGVSLSPPKQSPCSSSGKGAGCTYSPPPVVITTLKATCPSAVVTVCIKFYSPGQNCTINVPYNVGTSGSFTITNPNPSAVTVTPASQSL